MTSPIIKKLATVSLVCIFLVILAGSIVRATGSGMGCPDWPQCFGYNIPPSNIETLTWRSGKVFKQGQMILLDNHFWVANADLKTAQSSLQRIGQNMIVTSTRFSIQCIHGLNLLIV